MSLPSPSGVAAPTFNWPPSPDEVRPDWPTLFGADRPLHCEIGHGRGHFALDFARENDVNLVAIEMRRSDGEELRVRRDRLGLTNLEVIQGDARLYLPRFFAEGSVDAFHIHCPDPWWKKRHHRRRLVADDFGLLLYRLLKPGGELDLRTDVKAYAEAMVETCEQIIGFENVHGPGVERPAEGLVLSTRERRYRETGQPVYRFQYRRPDRPPQTEQVDRANGPT
jgi:tRNA (guanine-N7-)-methyltransferase